MDSQETFAQLQLRFRDPIQFDYETIRPVVLFAQPVTERSRETEIPRTTVGEKARRFIIEGMLGLVDGRMHSSDREGKGYPDPIANYILYLKQLYPPIHYREIVNILERKFGHKTNHHRVKRFLARHPVPVQLELKLVRFHDFEDAYEARWTVVRLFHEGWNKKSIAGLLQLSREHIDTLIEAFERDGFAGLEDKRTRPANHPHNQMTLPFLEAVFQVQQDFPRSGRFRVHGVLEQKLGDDTPSERTVGRAMAHNRHFRQAPAPWPPSKEAEAEPKELPYRPLYRHQYWFIDIRYLVELEGSWVYSICILEGYSRQILVGMVSPYQDELAILQPLHAALSEYGCPHGIVSDNGSVFTARAYQHVLDALEIEAYYIEKGKPWENLLEAQFKIQSRLADAQFEQATTLEEIQAQHAFFIQLFNTTNHWAHRDRHDGRTTPVAVLASQRGRPVALSQLRHVFRHLQFARTINRHGCVSIQRFYIYAERGLARERVAIWIYQDRLHLEYRQTLLARYTCRLDRHAQTLQAISHPKLYRTLFASPQLELFELDDHQWRKFARRPPYSPRKTSRLLAKQLPLFHLKLLIWFLLYC